jgi:hypothetical protein
MSRESVNILTAELLLDVSKELPAAGDFVDQAIVAEGLVAGLALFLARKHNKDPYQIHNSITRGAKDRIKTAISRGS